MVWSITLNEVKGKDLLIEGEMVLEETGNKPLEEVTQTVVTISAPTEHAFRECLLRIIDKYRAPRTVYSMWGSDERAKEIFARGGRYMGWLVLIVVNLRNRITVEGAGLDGSGRNQYLKQDGSPGKACTKGIR